MGVGSVLLAAALQWARANGLLRVVLETQSKNYPAICFAQKHGLVYCGYNDRYYPNQDVALFFGANLK
jgi:GNAT superfamily N-acetyltransferase